MILKLLTQGACPLDRITDVFDCDTAKALELIALAQLMGANIAMNSSESTGTTYSLRNWGDISIPVDVYLGHYESVASIEEFECMPEADLENILTDLGSD